MNIVIVDLDGTLVKCNSFHLWLKYITKYYLAKKRLPDLVMTLVWSFLRYSRIIKHSTLKKHIINLAGRIDDKVVLDFARTLNDCVNGKVKNLLAQCRHSDNTKFVLATAAPYFYVGPFSELHDFDYVIATPGNIASPEWVETIKEEKLKQFYEIFSNDQAEVNVAMLITDHHDDLSLMKISAKTILVNPSETTKQVAKNNNINIVEVVE